MGQEIYQANLACIEPVFRGWKEKLEDIKEPPCEIEVSTEESFTGETIFRVRKEKKEFYLNGKYNPSYAGIDWLERIEKIESFGVVVILGIHDGIHIKNILANIDENTSVLIYEPSLDIFLKALETIDLSFLFQEGRPIGVVVDGINELEMESYFKLMLNFDKMCMLKVYISDNYKKILPEKTTDFIDSLMRHVTDVKMNWNTLKVYSNVNAFNVFHNFKHLYHGYSVVSLHNILPEGIPTILVSAGPSLNKNLLDLKAAVGKANIIATDTAMNPLLNAGIIPNFFVAVDGMKPAVLFQHKDISKVPMVSCTSVAPKPMELHQGKKFFFHHECKLEWEIFRRIFQKEENLKDSVLTVPLDTGGSVANSGFSLGILMGSKTIILIGQDLALTGNKSHADGTFKEKMEDVDFTKIEKVEVESVDGEMVPTRLDLKAYLEWFESEIKSKPEIKVIDATEGGALIHGAEILTLKEAIARECTTEYSIQQQLEELPEMFGEKGKEEYIHVMKEIPRKLSEVSKKASIGLRYYKQLYKMVQKPCIDNQELQKLMKKIGKINRYIEQDYMADVLMDSLKDLEFMIRPHIYRDRENSKQEMEELSKKSQLVLKSMVKITKKIRELARDTILKDLLEIQETE